MRPARFCSALIGIGLLSIAAVSADRPVVIELSNGADLVAAVNAAPDGARIILGPGHYTLTARIQLKAGMTIEGSEVRRYDDGGVPTAVGVGAYAEPGTETVIEGGGLPPMSTTRTACVGTTDSLVQPVPILQLARGVSIRAVTIESGANLAVGEPAGVSGRLDVDVSDTVLHGTGRAMTFSNSGCAARHARSTLTFMRNVVRGAAAGGLLLSNSLAGNAVDDTDGPSIDATIAFNLFETNGNGLTLFGGDRGTDGASLTVRSTGNVFTGNRGNIFAIAGLANSVTMTTGNRLDLRSFGDVFGPSTSVSPLVPSLALRGGRRQGTAVEPAGNHFEADISHATFIRDSAATSEELSVIGCDFGSGSGNDVRMKVRQARVVSSAGAAMTGVVTVLDEAVPGVVPNVVRFIGSPQSFESTNQGLPAPPAAFFDR